MAEEMFKPLCRTKEDVAEIVKELTQLLKTLPIIPAPKASIREAQDKIAANPLERKPKKKKPSRRLPKPFSE